MDTPTIVIAGYLRGFITEDTPRPEIVYLARWLNETLQDESPNWIRMLAGASDECFTNPELFDALIDEVRSAMED